MFQVSTHS